MIGAGAALFVAIRWFVPEAPTGDESKLSDYEVELAALTPAAPAGKPVRLLFVGNSMVHTWNMPGLLLGLARTGGINLEIEQHTPIGYRLSQHEKQPRLASLLDSGGWDIVVLQEQTQLPAWTDEEVRSGMDPPATSIARRARAASPAARLVLYVTPAWRDGDTESASRIPEADSYAGMQTRTTATYRRLARDLGAGVAPAGEAWRRVRSQRPDIDLYRDESHPSKVGAYLIACVFYATLFDRNPEGSSFVAGLAPDVAAALQSAAWTTVQSEPGPPPDR